MIAANAVKALALAGVLFSRCPIDPPFPPGPGPGPTPVPVDAAPVPTPIDAGAPPDVMSIEAAPAEVGPSVPDTAPTEVTPAPEPEPGPAPTPPLPPAEESVTIELDTEHNHWLYAYDGGPGCNPAAGPPYVAEVAAGGSVCLPAGVGNVVVMPLDALQICRVGEGCEPCGSDPACLPRSCFAPLPAAAPGEACSATLTPKPRTAVTRYMVLPGSDPDAAMKNGLPKMLTVGETSEVVIRPPAEHSTFVIGRLDAPVNVTVPPGGECGETSICTILPLTFTAFGPGNFWNFWAPTPLWSWSVF